MNVQKIIWGSAFVFNKILKILNGLLNCMKCTETKRQQLRSVHQNTVTNYIYFSNINTVLCYLAVNDDNAVTHSDTPNSVTDERS